MSGKAATCSTWINPSAAPAESATVEAKRRIVDNATNMHTSGPEWDEAARILAAVYANHPEFDEAWRS